jgi:hypothetical protein
VLCDTSLLYYILSECQGVIFNLFLIIFKADGVGSRTPHLQALIRLGLSNPATFLLSRPIGRTCCQSFQCLILQDHFPNTSIIYYIGYLSRGTLTFSEVFLFCCFLPIGLDFLEILGQPRFFSLSTTKPHESSKKLQEHQLNCKAKF